MSGGEAHQQGLHLCRLWRFQVCWGETLWLHHDHSWKEAEADVPCEGKVFPVLWVGLRKGWGGKLGAPYHTDVWL